MRPAYLVMLLFASMQLQEAATQHRASVDPSTVQDSCVDSFKEEDSIER